MKALMYPYFAQYKCRMCGVEFTNKIVGKLFERPLHASWEAEKFAFHECNGHTGGMADLKGVRRDLDAKPVEV